MRTISHKNWQMMMAKLERPPEEVVRLRCLGTLFGVYGDHERFIEYIVEAEHQDGYGYWSDHFLNQDTGEIDFEALIEDVRIYLEEGDSADTG